MLPPLCAVLFDLDDTLTDRRPTVDAYARKFAVDFRERLTVLDPIRLADELRGADRSGYNPERGADIAELAVWSKSPSPIEIEAHWSQQFPEFAIARRGCLQTLQALRASGLRLAIVSNGSTAAQHRKLQTLGIHELFEAIVVSEELGVKKPDPRIFQSALDQLALGADSCAFVGDNPTNDVHGAAAVGLHAVWLRAALPWPAELPQPTHQIDALEELLALLGP